MAALKLKKIIFKVALAALIPMLALGIPSYFLDRALGTSPWILLGALLVGLQLTLLAVLLLVKKIFIEYQNPSP